MNTRIPGLLLIALGAAAAVRGYLRLCRGRIRALSALGSMLELMQGELESAALPMDRLLEALEPRLEEPARRFAAALRVGLGELGRRSFSEIWETSLAACLPELGAPELDALRQLGALLGRYELPRQLEALRACRQKLRQREEEERAALTERTRLALGLGFTGAALLSIVLM